MKNYPDEPTAEPVNKSYCQLQYELNAPLRIKAATEYYLLRMKYSTLAEARKKAPKIKDFWICLIQIETQRSFYVATHFQYKWIYKGFVCGIWNELTVIEKTKK